jgi:PemK-like, MazF-like toxin of type II toxin-antitoxin system
VRRAESKSHRHNSVRPADQQSEVGLGAWKSPLISAPDSLPKDSVANVSQIITLDKDLLTDRVGKLPRQKLELLLSGIDVILGK